MKQCEVPECGHMTDREMCPPHWRRVPGSIKRDAHNATESHDPIAYRDAIDRAIDAVRFSRNVS